MKSFVEFLTEMPLPKDVDPTSLEPKVGKYTKASAEKVLTSFGEKVGKGSSRTAYRVHVEKEQFGDEGHVGLPETPEGKVDTVIKLATNPKGIAQNEEELEVFRDYGHNGFLLPIIDSSKQHKRKLIIQQGSGKPEFFDDSKSNWIQMPYVQTFKEPSKFDIYFLKYFGDFKGYFKSIKKSISFKFNFQFFNSINQDKLQEFFEDLQPNDYISEQQLENIHELLELSYAGLKFRDLGRLVNWGIYKGKPVILDYGFSQNTVGLYNGAQQASAYVDKNKNIILNIRKVPPRSTFW